MIMMSKQIKAGNKGNAHANKQGHMLLLDEDDFTIIEIKFA